MAIRSRSRCRPKKWRLRNTDPDPSNLFMNASKISIVPILQAGDQPADLNQAAEDGEEAARRRSRTSRCVTCYSEAVDFRAARKLAQVRKVLYIFLSPPLSRLQCCGSTSIIMRIRDLKNVHTYPDPRRLTLNKTNYTKNCETKSFKMT